MGRDPFARDAVGTVLANQAHTGPGQAGDPGAEQTELAVAQDRQARPRPEVDLLGDPERGGQWLDEQGRAVADGVRDLVEVGLRDAHPFGHRAVVVEDAQNGPVRAVLGTAGVAGVATPAGVVDLGRHPASVGRFADELVAEHPSNPM